MKAQTQIKYNYLFYSQTFSFNNPRCVSDAIKVEQRISRENSKLKKAFNKHTRTHTHL